MKIEKIKKLKALKKRVLTMEFKILITHLHLIIENLLKDLSILNQPLDIK